MPACGYQGERLTASLKALYVRAPFAHLFRSIFETIQTEGRPVELSSARTEMIYERPG